MAGHETLSISGAAPDHALGQYQAWRAPGAQATALDLAWTSIARSETPAAHRLLPHGEPSIALVRRRDRHGAVCELDLQICGPYYKGKHYTPAPREELIAWRVKPELAAALFGVAPADYSHHARITAPKKLQAACAKTLALGESANTQEILISLNADLSRLARDKNASHGPEIFAAQRLRETNGQMRLRDLASQLQVSERHLRRRFTDHVGCSPKIYARHLQITAAALIAENTVDPNWAAIAVWAGFHDQPHFINAFRSEMGVTPRVFHQERRALL